MCPCDAARLPGPGRLKVANADDSPKAADSSNVDNPGVAPERSTSVVSSK
jgi:hypothetical protein